MSGAITIFGGGEAEPLPLVPLTAPTPRCIDLSGAVANGAALPGLAASGPVGLATGPLTLGVTGPLVLTNGWGGPRPPLVTAAPPPPELLLGTAGADRLFAGALGASVVGAAGADWLEGGAGNDTIRGQGGNDTILGRGGENLLDGGDGDDVLEGGAANDSLIGGAGADVLFGGTGDNRLDGGAGADTLVADFGDSRLFGGDGNDVVVGSGANASLYGGAGDDTLLGAERYRWDGAGNRLDGEAGDDVLLGGFRQDRLFGGTGADKLNGRAGNDVVLGGSGDDVLHGGYGLDMLAGGQGADSLSGGDDNDTLRGDAGNDLLDGGFEDDLLEGAGGNDSLYGGWGNDTLLGGQGDDVLSADGTTGLGAAGQEPAFYQPTRPSYVPPPPPSHVYDGTMTSTLWIHSSNALIKIVVPTDNLLVGGVGADTMQGGGEWLGDDIFRYDSKHDSTLASRDVILNFEQTRDLIDLSIFGVDFGAIRQTQAGDVITVTVELGATDLVFDVTRGGTIIQGEMLRAADFIFGP